MRQKIWGVIVVALIILGIVWWNQAPDSKVTSAEPIKIGGIFSLTGRLEVAGKTEANFARLAIDEINRKGGVNGQSLELILEDDKCSGKDAVSAASKLINEDKVKIILGPSCTPASGAVVPVTDKAQVLMVAFTTTANGIFDKFNYAFRMSPPSEVQGKLIADLAYKKYGLRKVVTITEATDFGKSWTKDFETRFQELGGVIVKAESYLTGATDFRQTILGFKVLAPEGIFISGQAPQDAGLIIKQMNDIGFLSSLKVMGNPTLIDAKTLEASGGALPAAAFSVSPYLAHDGLLKKYRETFNEEPGFQLFYTASAYDAVYILAQALEVCGNDASCANKFLKQDLKPYRGQVTTWSFAANGDPIINRTSYRELHMVKGQITQEAITIKE